MEERSIFSRLMASGFSGRLGYLTAQDRYLSAQERPILRLGIIGCGINGQEHIVNTAFEGRAFVKGFFDTSEESSCAAAELYRSVYQGKEPVIYDSLQEICEDPEIDALIISTPNHTHIEVLREVAPFGKHLLLEKPMASTVEDAFEITQMARDYQSVFQIGLQYRYKAIYVEALQEILGRKNLGIVRTISMTEHRIPFLDKVGQWNKFSECSGGTLVEKCCHYFDLMNCAAASRPVRIFASGSQAVNYKDFTYADKHSNILDNASVIIEYENGIRGEFHLNMFSPLFYEELVVCGDRGRLHASETQDFLADSSTVNSLSVHTSGHAPSTISNPRYPAAVEALGHNGSTLYEHMNFVDNILGKETSTATVAEGFLAVAAAAAAQESIRTGMPVTMDEFLRAHGIPG